MADNVETISYINLGDGENHPIKDPSAFDNVEYDSQVKRINFKHGNTVLKYIDATDFIKDGMVDSVSILASGSDSDDNGTLVVTFNTDAGKENIEIPLNQVFDPSNYYSKRRADQVFVKYNTSQNLNSAHQEQARQNIGAGILNGITFNGVSASVSNGIAAITATIPEGLPTVSSSDNGKILQVVNGQSTLVSPVGIYSGNSVPSNSTGDNGDLYLQTN